LDTWHYGTAHDSAAACEDKKREMLIEEGRSMEHLMTTHAGQPPKSLLDLYAKAKWYKEHWRCVPYELWWSKQK